VIESNLVTPSVENVGFGMRVSVIEENEVDHEEI
jgi:hypothetical protein